MAYFDLTSATSNAYRTTWNERRYLMRLAALPVALKLFFFTLAVSYAPGDGQHLRFVLIMVPALLAEGWMLSHYVRLIVLGHRWPFRPTGDMQADFAVLAVRARGILSGMISFTLINMTLGLFVALVMAYLLPYMPESEGAAANVPGGVAFFSLALLVFMFWAFRLIWLYIPFSLNMDPLSYLDAIRGIGSSLHLIGIWFLCFLPFFLGLQFMAGLIAGPVAASTDGVAGSFLLVVFKVLFDTLKNIVATAGLTYAFMQLYEKDGQ